MFGTKIVFVARGQGLSVLLREQPQEADRIRRARAPELREEIRNTNSV